jgi:endonuclease YncB( thermonuclease family)
VLFRSCRPLDTDRYGRIVAQCYIEDQDIAAWSVANGWAMARASYSIEYMGVQRRAVSSHRGILSGSFDDPQSFRKAQ